MLGRMKRLLANVVMAVGGLIAIVGLLGTPFVSDHLPVSWSLPGAVGSRHVFIRWVPASPQPPGYVPYIWLLAGATLLIVGVIWRRRLRGNAA